MASRLQDVILRGLAAAKPAATTVAPGTLYYSTDTLITERCADTGLIWESYADSGGGGGGGPHAATHAAAGSDPVTLSESQITNLTTDLAAKAPLVHASRHSAAGADPVTVTNLAGYPGGTANFLRADGAFAAPPVGAGITQLTGDVTAGPGSGSQAATLANTAVTPGPYTNMNATVDAKGRITAASNGSASVPAHHTTHEPGGSDPMAVDAAAATGSLRTLGTGATQAASGTDSRFTNARTPTAHATTHEPGGSDPMAVNAAAATGSLRTLSTTGTSACAGNDARLSDARTPTAHHTTHEPGGSDPLAVDAVAATGSLRTLGTGAQQATAGNDSRLTNARTPTAHATTHSNGGSDPVTVTNLAGYPGGTTNFLRADGTFAAPPAGGGGILRVLCMTMDGTGLVPLTGIRGIFPCPFAGTIIGWTVTGDTTTGSFSADVCKKSGSAPPTAPSVPNTTTDKISSTQPISITTAQTASSGTAGISAWTTVAVAQWDSILFNVTFITVHTRIQLQLLIQT